MKHTPSDKNACRLGFAADSTTMLVQCSGASCPFAGPSSVPQKPKHRHRTMHASHDHYRMGAAVGTALEIVSRKLMTILILQLLKLECRTFGANHLKRWLLTVCWSSPSFLALHSLLSCSSMPTLTPLPCAQCTSLNPFSIVRYARKTGHKRFEDLSPQ
jgi:hypothetical protein